MGGSGWLHAHALYGATRDSTFVRFLSWTHPESVEDVKKRLEGILDKVDGKHMLALSIFDAQNQDWLALFLVMPANGGPEDLASVECALVVNPSYWNSGVATRIARLFLSCIFEATTAEGVVGRYVHGNVAAKSLHKQMGFEVYGTAQLPSEKGVFEGEVVLLRKPT